MYLGLVATVVVVDGFGTERMIYDGVSDLRREVPLAVLCSMCVCGVWCVVLLVGLCFDFGRSVKASELLLFGGPSVTPHQDLAESAPKK